MTLPEQPDVSVDSVPLFVDLDGTLVATDTSVGASFRLIRRNLGYALRLPLWLLRGRAYLKRCVAERVPMQPDALPFRRDFLDFLRSEHRRGRRLILATAADQTYADAVADHLAIFEAAVGSDGATDRGGPRKLAKIREITEGGPFDYAGDDLEDLAIFPQARRAILSHPVPPVRSAARRMDNVERIFDEEPRRLRDPVLALRPQEWPANLMVLLPLLLTAGDPATPWLDGLLGVLAFCLCASSLVLYYDLLHLPELRRLPPKLAGPVASGRVALQRAGQTIPILAIPGFLLAGWVSWSFLSVLLGIYLFAVLVAQDWYALPRLIFACAFFVLRVVAGFVLLPGIPPVWVYAVSLAAAVAAGVVAERLDRDRVGYL